MLTASISGPAGSVQAKTTAPHRMAAILLIFLPSRHVNHDLMGYDLLGA
jgi:hypothetical protein